jgi:hypothetical protein
MNPETRADRNAVIVIHGVADQVRGETAAAVAAQLAHALGGNASRTEIAFDVPWAEPASDYAQWQPHGVREQVSKSLRQSVRSDFLADNLGGSPQDACTRPNSAASPSGVQAGRQTADHGARYTDFLLAKAKSGRTADAPPQTCQVPLFEVSHAGIKTDVIEMYWADLSRLSSNAPRILTELFTLLFHLSKLGSDGLGLTAKLFPKNAALQAANFFQRSADWLFTRWLALLSLQLVVCVLLLLPRAFLAGQALGHVAAGLLLVFGVCIAAIAVYRCHWHWATAVVCCIAPAAVLARALVVAVGSQWPGGAPWLMLLWIGAVAITHDLLLRFCEERFRAVLGIGRLLLTGTLVAVLIGGQAYGLLNWDGWAHGVLAAIETLLLGHVVVWVLMSVSVVGLVLAGWLAGILAKPSGDAGTPSGRAQVRQAIVTGRVGLFVSMGSFVAFTMTAWALLSKALQATVENMHYGPWWFGNSPVSAQGFLEQRLSNSTQDFAPLALVLLLLIGFVILAFLPSLLVELRAARGLLAQRLGRWLSRGYCTIERMVGWWSWLVMALLLAAGAVLVASQVRWWAEHDPERFTTWPALTGLAGQVLALMENGLGLTLQNSSSTSLSLLVNVLTGGAVGLIAIGGLAFNKIRALRGPLDVALDVDNHFREFPRKAISRVCIVERYAALLQRVVALGYRRVVIVSHSQGTVITADLLRYLQQRERLLPASLRADDDPWVRLGRQLAAKQLRLLTVGSPLRQLYALRFPILYAWVLAQQGGQQGPDPASLGVARWVNLWGSGDYVGRWLWATATDVHPQALQRPAADFSKAPSTGPTWRDECLGAEAHTHYFELEKTAVTLAIVELLG